MAGRKGTTLAGWPIAADGLLYAQHQRFRDELRTHEVEPEMGDLVGSDPTLSRRQHVAPHNPEAHRCACFHVRVADALAELERVVRTRVTDDMPLDVVVSGMHCQGGCAAPCKHDPRGLPLRECQEVTPRVFDECGPPGVWRKRNGILNLLGRLTGSVRRCGLAPRLAGHEDESNDDHQTLRYREGYAWGGFHPGIVVTRALTINELL